MTIDAPTRFPFADHPGPEPAPELARLDTDRALVPVVLHDGQPAVLVTRHADVRAVLTSSKFSRLKARTHGMTARKPESLALNSVDPPDHTRRRRVVAGAFTALRIEQLREMVEQLTDETLDAMAEQGSSAELIAAFTRPLPVAVMCRMLGIPAKDTHLFRPWVDAMMCTTAYTPDQISAAHDEMYAYFSAQVDDRRARLARGEPADDLLGELVRPHVTERLSHAEVVNVSLGLLIAGYETTTNQLAMCVYQLLEQPESAERLRADPTGVPAAVEELLRWTSLLATGGVPHLALEDVPVGDEIVRAGQIVVPVIDAANHDPEIFPDPYRLDLDREAEQHLAFGHGRHHCLGVHLARLELQVALDRLLRRFPGLRLDVAADDLRWRSGMFIRGLWELPVRW